MKELRRWRDRFKSGARFICRKDLNMNKWGDNSRREAGP